jgi:glycosyltransferase involved in cell wall biosynthesis
MNINIFILCYNERLLLPQTVHHYRSIFPSCIITIYDNESTDDSVEIANELGCNVISWSSNNENNAYMKMQISNNCWKGVKDGWIIAVDMDEWLCISESILVKEQEKGTTILSTQGFEMVGESDFSDLNDIQIKSIKRGVAFDIESKAVCFYRPLIKEINYSPGCHKCHPIGVVKFSSDIYMIKHYSFIGLPFIINKMTDRFERSKRLIKEYNVSAHYSSKIEDIKTQYYSKLKSSYLIKHYSETDVYNF